jgi:ELWxxDGT repeat protein
MPATTLDPYIADWHLLLQGWSADGRLSEAAQEALLLDGEPSLLTALIEQWTEGDFSGLPPIVLLPASSMPGAAGAYANSTGTIYLNEDWLQTASQEQVLAVLTQELGHHLDNLLNSSDTPGDEGALFAALLANPDLSAEEIEAYRSADDSGVILVDGNFAEAEKASIDGISALDLAILTGMDSEVTQFNNITKAGDLIFFISSNKSGSGNRRAWGTDGTKENTISITTTSSDPGSIYIDGRYSYQDPAYITKANNRIIFFDLMNGEFWTSSAADPFQFNQYKPEDYNNLRPRGSLNSGFPVFNDYAYFSGLNNTNNDTIGLELWRTNGTPEGTTLFLDLNPGISKDGSSLSSNPNNFRVDGGYMYFEADYGEYLFANQFWVSEPRLWKTDGTEVGTNIESFWFNPRLNPAKSTPVFSEGTDFNNQLKLVYTPEGQRIYGWQNYVTGLYTEILCLETDDYIYQGFGLKNRGDGAFVWDKYLPFGPAFNNSLNARDLAIRIYDSPKQDGIFDRLIGESSFQVETVNDGQAFFRVIGNPAVNNTLKAELENNDPDGNGDSDFSYAWQASSNGSSWSTIGTTQTGCSSPTPMAKASMNRSPLTLSPSLFCHRLLSPPSEELTAPSAAKVAITRWWVQQKPAVRSRSSLATTCWVQQRPMAQVVFPMR